MTRLSCLALLALVGLSVRLAAAHAIGLSRGEYQTLADGVTAHIVFDAAELGALLDEPLLADRRGDGPNAAAAWMASAARSLVERRIVERVRVTDRAGRACPGALRALDASDGVSVRVDAAWHCAGAPQTAVELGFWDALTPGHRHLALATGSPPDGGSMGVTGGAVTLEPAAGEQILYERASRLELVAAPVTPTPSFLEWIRIGVEHILGGYDHLLFLLALVIVTPVARTLAATVSIFTLAHSITLALATFGVVAPPSSWVECAIALSIVYVGLENLTPRAARPRFALVFAFGLIHGFGFAGALAELGLPAAQAPGALLSFNAGVELGQLAVLAAVFPLVHHFRRTPWFAPRAVPALSVATALAGAVWFFERV